MEICDNILIGERLSECEKLEIKWILGTILFNLPYRNNNGGCNILNNKTKKWAIVNPKWLFLIHES